MNKEILFINIGYENGLFTFKNEDVCTEIPESIMVNTPFYNQENSLEELVDTISMEPEEDIVFAYNYYNQNLVKRLADILAGEYDKKIYFVNSEFEHSLCSIGDGNQVYLLTKYEDLENLEELKFSPSTIIPEVSCPDKEEKTTGYFAAMRNGYDAFVTGIYPENMSNTLAKHVQLETDMVIQDASNYLDINGAFLVKEDNNCYVEIVDASNYNHLHMAEAGQVRFDDSENSYKRIVCKYSQFADWKKQRKLQKDTVYYLKTENKQDLDCFATELEYFKETAKVSTISARLADECRWTQQCSLKRLTRYRVVDGNVKPCITSEKSLVSVEEDSNKKLLEANKLCDRTMIQRKCMECSMKAVCSMCACLPEAISQEQYCEFIHKYPYVGQYLLKKRIVNFLGSYSKLFGREENVEVSSSVHCFEYPKEKTDIVPKRNAFIFRKGQDYYYLHLQNGSLIKLEGKYVFLLEAWVLEESTEQITENMVTKYELSFEQAEMVVKEGYQHLKKRGMIS